jgi:RNA polymerase sigma-70 factor (ECF subfamily)
MDTREIAKVVARGEQRWPGVKVAPKAFAAHVRAVLPSGAPLAASLEALHAEDLYLACACATGDDRALQAFEAEFLPQVADYVAQIDRDPVFVDEVRQRLRERLFVPAEAGARLRICEYTGRGALGAWLRVVAVRLALNLRRRAKATVPTEGDDAPALRSPSPDPEVDYLKTRYGEEFRAAFKATLGALPQDERNLLKLHYLDGLNIDEIGVAYRVHRATVARWLASARERILEETRSRLAERLDAGSKDVDSVLALVRSQLDVSIYNVLKS